MLCTTVIYEQPFTEKKASKITVARDKTQQTPEKRKIHIQTIMFLGSIRKLK